MNFGKRLKQKRISLKLTQDEFAKSLYISRQTISNWENGKTLPDIDSLILISNIYDISLDELIKGDKNIQKNITINNILISKYQILIQVLALFIILYAIIPLKNYRVLIILLGFGLYIYQVIL